MSLFGDRDTYEGYFVCAFLPRNFCDEQFEELVCVVSQFHAALERVLTVILVTGLAYSFVGNLSTFKGNQQSYPVVLEKKMLQRLWFTLRSVKGIIK